jgi:hypothetical protein
MFDLNLIGYADNDIVIVCSNCKMLPKDSGITPKCQCVTKAQFDKTRDLFYMYEQALKDILYTMQYLKREVESSGDKFNGSEAVILNNNLNFIKGIAQDTLKIVESYNVV